MINFYSLPNRNWQQWSCESIQYFTYACWT